MKTNKKFVLVEKPLFSPISKSDFEIGKGVQVNLELITEPLAEFLKQEYLKDIKCLSGNVTKLFELRKKDFLKIEIDY